MLLNNLLYFCLYNKLMYLNTMSKIKRIEKYLFEFFDNRFEHLDVFYRSVHRDREYGVYKLKNGNQLMDVIISIHACIEDEYYSKRLIPHKFVTLESLILSLDNFKKYLNNQQYLLDQNIDEVNTSDIIIHLQEIKDELIQMIDYVKQMFDAEDDIVPYQDLRYNLIIRDIPAFVKILKSLLASVPYAITKTKEGYYHSNVHLILRLLGFNILSEDMTNIGRIDAVIRFSNTIYIFEFKFDKKRDLSKDALQQIKENAYYEKFILERNDIYAIGISFSEEVRNINGFKYEIIRFD